MATAKSVVRSFYGCKKFSFPVLEERKKNIPPRSIGNIHWEAFDSVYRKFANQTDVILIQYLFANLFRDQMFARIVDKEIVDYTVRIAVA